MSGVAGGVAGPPAVGLGLWKLERDRTADVVSEAIRIGYRHLDSACDYGNEREAGEGMRRAIAAGHCRRDDLWITSKLWNTYHEPSRVRAALFGPEQPRFTGVVSYRSVVPTERVRHVPEIEAFTKWWGPNPHSQIVTFPLSLGQETFVFATTGQSDWTEESWTSPGDVEELRRVYHDYHPDARALLQACDSVMKSALYERDPLPRWSVGRATLLGDASHPMLPFMAQGAGMAIEDAVVLSRAIDQIADVPSALKSYEEARRERTAQIQIGSRGNQWMKTQGNADGVYGYDAWGVAL